MNKVQQFFNKTQIIKTKKNNSLLKKLMKRYKLIQKIISLLKKIMHKIQKNKNRSSLIKETIYLLNFQKKNMNQD